MDPWRSPERIGAAHLPNQVTNLTLYSGPPGSGAPTPKQTESLTVPLDDGGRLDQHHHLQTAWPQSVERNPEQAVESKQPETTRPLAAKNVQLMAEGEVL